MRYRRTSLLIAVVGVALLTIPIMANAAVTLQTETDYSGGNENADQSIEVTITLSPDGSKFTDATVQIRSTDRSFIDYNSFTKKVDPADSNVTVQSTNQPGVFRINEVDPGETVTITFEVYPKEIKQTSLDVANVDVSYVQNGQELSESRTATADLSSSPWFKYQNAQGGDGGNSISLGIAAIVGVVIGAMIALVAARRMAGGAETQEEEEPGYPERLQE